MICKKILFFPRFISWKNAPCCFMLKTVYEFSIVRMAFGESVYRRRRRNCCYFLLTAGGVKQPTEFWQ